MANVRIRGDASDLVEATSRARSLADDYSSDGLEPDEIWPRLAAIEDLLDAFRAEVRRALRDAA